MKYIDIKRKDFNVNGIYCIKNIVNNKCYIGSCSSKTFMYERLIHHKNDLIFNRHCNTVLQRAFNKYGIDNFDIFIIEKCTPIECLDKEQYWINNLKPEYNICKIAGSSFGREVSIETRNKISTSNKKWFNEHPEFGKRQSVLKSGRVLPKEQIQKFIISRTGKYHSVESKNKMKESAFKRAVIDLLTNNIYDSILEASIKTLKSTTCITNHCNNKYKTQKYKFL